MVLGMTRTVINSPIDGCALRYELVIYNSSSAKHETFSQTLPLVIVQFVLLLIQQLMCICVSSLTAAAITVAFNSANLNNIITLNIL